MKQRVLAIVGPTAVGKTELSLRLAERLRGEIISADSMQVYRGMDIGTAKPSLEERSRCPHHLVDVVGVGETFSAADYQRLAREVVADIAGRGKLPIFSGGTGLYLKAALDNYNFTAPENDKAVRLRLQQELQTHGIEALYTRLAQIDPLVAARLSCNDHRRIIRALEVFESTGRPLSAWEAEKDVKTSLYDAVIVGLQRPREDLYARIDMRVDHMVAIGLLEEVRKVYEQGLSLVAGQALGYKELIAHLEGRISLEEAATLLKRQTRHYAKRQMTWFRADRRVNWIDAQNLENAERSVLEILAKEWHMQYNE